MSTILDRLDDRFPRTDEFPMSNAPIDTSICCLCGEPIERNPASPEDVLSMDHVPPKQFYPKELRSNRSPNLWLVPTHKRCNQAYREHEEYFYHAMYGVVQTNNQRMGKQILADFARRIHKPQTPAIMRHIRKTFTTVTEGGIHLPPEVVQFSVDRYRSQSVVIKIAQGLIYRDCGVHAPRESCKDIRDCLDESNVPELYRLSWQGAESKTVCPDVFSYRRFEFENLHLLSMLFWESLMFCCAFEDLSLCHD
jgi:hypothetical protein